MDEHKHGQILSLKSSRGINQHAFNGRAVVGLPLVRLALREVALREQLVESGDRAGILQFVGAFGEINFSRLLERGVDDRDARRVIGGRDTFVAACPAVQLGKGI